VSRARTLAGTSVATLVALVGPRSAAACTWCMSSAFGDRSFTWPYLILLLAPFVVGTAIALVLARSARFDPRAVAARLVGRAAVGAAPETTKETI
jgi:hypothetical protein